MKNIALPFRYVTAKQYSKLTGMPYKAVLSQCEKGNLEAFREDVEGAHWQIKVWNNESISKKDYEKLLNENAELKTVINNITKIADSSLCSSGAS